MSKTTLIRVAAAMVVTIALGVGIACASTNNKGGSNGANTSTPAASANTSDTNASRTSTSASSAPAAEGVMTTADLVKFAEPAVVKITTASGVGTGFVIAADGYIVTNNHVITSTGFGSRSSQGIQVLMTDGSTYRATVAGSDARSDLALLKIDASGLKPLKLANLADVQVGEDVVAIGYALDLSGGDGAGFSVTRGIVSAKNRATSETSGTLGAVQTDAAINHGNSGGPLLDLTGAVVGVNTSIAPDQTTGGIAPGIGFAIGSDMVQAVYDALRSSGKVDRGLLGIRNFSMLLPAKAKEIGVPTDIGGVYLATQDNIQPGGPAASAGLQGGDTIVAVGGTPVRNESDLTVAMVKHHPNEKVDVQVYRNGKKMTLQVTLGTPPTS